MQPKKKFELPIDIVSIKSIDHLTHDVIRIFTDKPRHYTYIPGTEISINKNGWRDKIRPFTFTSLPDRNYLEFIIKTYPDHHGVTNQLLKLVKDDELILHGAFGAIHFRGEGVFIAGGAGITPFIPILRSLEARRQIKDNKLIFANKTKADIILKEELEKIMGDNFINVLSEEDIEGYHHGLISEDIINSVGIELTTQFYVCGPPPMMEAVILQLEKLGIDEKTVIRETL